MRSSDVVGYTYQADVYCDDHMRAIAKRQLVTNDVATMWGDCGSAEDIIGEWASAIGLDRDDESTFDSGDFPKVIPEELAHADCTLESGCIDRCIGCGQPIGYDCTLDDVEV